MADILKKKLVIVIKVCTISFSGSLITNLISDLSNSKWQTQNGGLIVKKKSYCPESMYYKLFGVAAYKSDIKFIKFKMADPKWQTYFEKKIVMPLKVCRYYMVFGVADYEFEIKFIKFKMESYLLITSEQF
jgi:hypothetical protein